MNYRMRKDGTIDFVHKGKPPACPEGYLPDPQDKWHFIPDVGHCQYRAVSTREVSCCGNINTLCCKYLNLPIGYKSCMKCDFDWLESIRLEGDGGEESD